VTTQPARARSRPSKAKAKPSFQLPYTTVDVVIFTVLDDALQVLLVQRPAGGSEPHPGRWALPGGFVNVDKDADLVGCARRKLKEKTGLVSPFSSSSEAGAALRAIREAGQPRMSTSL